MDTQSIDPSNPFFMFDVTKICATCSKNLLKDKSFSLKEPISKDTETKSFEFLQSLFEFKYEDNGPTNICSECYQKVRQTFQFYNKCKKSMELFEKYMEYQEEFTSLDEIELKTLRDEDEDDIQIESIMPKKPEKSAEINIKNVKFDKVEEEYKLLEEVENMKTNPEKTKLVCKYCGLEFKSCNTTYRDHINIHKKLFVCSVCGKAVGSKFKLDIHEQSHVKLSYECEICSKVFLRLMDKNKHVLVAHKGQQGKAEYKCAVCSAVFESSTAYDYHMNIHEKKYYCSLCETSFGCRKHLVAHRKSHTGELQYSCSKCSLAFRTKRGLYQHSATHQPRIKVFKCDKCQKCFDNLKTLYAHKDEHSEKEHKCPACDRTFVYSSQMKKHYETLHLKEIDIRQGSAGNEACESEKEVEHIIIEVTNDYLLANIRESNFVTGGKSD